MVKLFFPSNNRIVFQNIKLTLVPFVICLTLFSFAEASSTEQMKINLVGGAPLDLRPFSGNSSWKTVMNLVCDRLYNRDITSGQLEPSLADSYEVAADNSSFTLHLKPGLKFHNKESITAEDVKFSFEVFREPKIRSLSKDHLAKSISKIEILDPLTLKMYPTDAHFFNLDVALNDYFVIPKKHYSRPKNLTSKSRLPICSGPFQVTSWTPGQAVELTRFSEWESNQKQLQLPLFKFQKIVFTFISDETRILNNIQNDLLDFSFLPEITKSQQKDIPKVIQERNDDLNPRGNYLVGFNFQHPILQDKEVRLALYYAINRALFNDTVLQGMRELSNGPFRWNSMRNSQTQPLEFDLKRAATILTKNGWIMDEADGIRKKTMNGVPTKLKLVLSYANRFYEELWKRYQSDLKSIGVELVLRFYTTPEFFKSMDLGKLDMWAMGWNEDIYEPDLSRSWHSRVPGKEAFGSHNYGGYSNKMVDRLIEEGMYTSNRKKRNQLLMQAGRLIADDVPALFLFDEKYYRTAMSPHLTRTSLSQRFGMGIENLVKLANLPSNLKSKEAENVAK